MLIDPFGPDVGSKPAHETAAGRKAIEWLNRISRYDVDERAVRIEPINGSWASVTECEVCGAPAAFFVIPPDFGHRGPSSIRIACATHAELEAITMVTGADR